MTFDIAPHRHLYPFESHWHEVGGKRMHYVDEGRGEPVVLVHGNPTWSFYFRNLIAGLRNRYRVVAPDHIGCGLSDKPSNAEYSYRLEQRVADLQSLIDHLQLGDDLTFGVHDWGGMIGLTCALRMLERVQRVIVFNTAAFGLPSGKRLPLRLRIVRNIPPLANVLVRGFNAFSEAATRMACVKPLPTDVRSAYVAPYDSWANRIATLRFVQDIPLRSGDPSYDLVRWTDENLNRLDGVPMLICWGDRDFVFDSHILAEWKRRFPAASVHAFADAGHYVLEDAGDEILALVREFLTQHPVSNRPAEPVENVS